MDYPDQSIFAALSQTAQQCPARTALSCMEIRTSYAALLSQIEQTARGFLQMGIGRGDRFAICLPTCPQAVIALYALNRIGAVANFLHPQAAPAQVVFFLRRFSAKGLLTQPGGLAQADVPEIPVLTELPRAELPLPPEDGKSRDAAVLLYSGGTTGKPKGILLSNSNLNAIGRQILIASGNPGGLAGRKLLSALPMFHGFGLAIGVHAVLLGGGTCVLLPQFSRQGCAEMLLREKPDYLIGVPTLFLALQSAAPLQTANLSFLKGVFSGGDAFPAAQKRELEIFLQSHQAPISVREGYGLTECGTVCCLMPPNAEKEGAVGLPMPDTYVKIVRTGTQQSLPIGQEGEICISGPSVMLGYCDEPEETSRALWHHADGKIWLHTGDLGCMDQDGFLYFHRRLQRMIITSGYNVYPNELEALLLRHAQVESCCVVGVPDAVKLHKVRAYVVAKGGKEHLLQALQADCRRYLAAYAQPEIVFCETLPKTALGKIDYRRLERA